MNGLDQDEMAEALNLTRAGRLTEDLLVLSDLESGKLRVPQDACTSGT